MRSLRYAWKPYAAVAAGVAVATTVLTGALLLGGAVPYSLSRLTRDRLGQIDDLVTGSLFFREDRVVAWRSSDWFQTRYERAVPAILAEPVVVETVDRPSMARIHDVMLVAIPDTFWRLGGPGSPHPARPMRSGEVILNEPAARALGVRAGDRVTLRLAMPGTIPSESPFGKRDALAGTLLRRRVVEVLPARGLGRFSRNPRPAPPPLAFVPLADMQSTLDRPERINTVFLQRRSELRGAPDTHFAGYLASLHLKLADAECRLETVRIGGTPGSDEAGRPETTESAARPIVYHTLWSDRLLIPPKLDEAVARALGKDAVPILTYLANEIRPLAGDGRAVPYSLISAVDFGPLLPMPDEQGKRLERLGPGEMVVTRWLADEAKLAVGDRVRVTYFAPESPHGKLEEREAEFQVRAITPLARPAQPYFPKRRLVFSGKFFLANDPFLTPPVKGFTDQASINRWDVPFPVDYKRVKPADEAYWKWYGTTPKAYIGRAEGVRLWGSRFGRTTSWRIGIDRSPESIEAAITRAWDAAALGLVWDPIRTRQLAASSGTTPFDMLFLGLSFFVIVAALLLVWLLYRLHLERRERWIGLLTALGFARRRTSAWLVLEGTVAALAGAVVGCAGGIGYLHLVVWALDTIWVGAIAYPFLVPHVGLVRLAAGGFSGWVVALATVGWGAWRTAGRAPVAVWQHRQEPAASGPRVGRRARWLGLAAAGLAVGLSWWARSQSGLAQAGLFVSAGFGFLVASWLFVWDRFQRARGAPVAPLGRRPPVRWRWAGRMMVRNPVRSITAVMLVGASSFLVMAMTAFRAEPTERGTGGYTWIGELSVPVFLDWSDPAARSERFGADAQRLRDVRVVPVRVRDGSDAACTNLYRPASPRVLGVGPAWAEADRVMGKAGRSWRVRFAPGWSWERLVRAGSTEDGATPVVIDENTARYSLGLTARLGERFTLTYDGRVRRFELVGLLGASVLQGLLVTGEPAFAELFPHITGHRMWFVAAPPGRRHELRGWLEATFRDQGLVLIDARARLAAFLAVQNTYLSTFQSLGVLGLLLGTFGLVAVQSRNAWDRQRELALLRAVGFRPRVLVGLVFRENVGVLTLGLVSGAGCALVAVLPVSLARGVPLPWIAWSTALLGVWLAGAATSLAGSTVVLRLPLLGALRNE